MAPALVGCGAGSSRPSLVSAKKERELGQEAANEVEQTVGLVQDPVLLGYVREIGRRLALQAAPPEASYEFHVADDSEPNAFALPGGFVYVTRGILALVNSEDELAGVIGHEMGHVVARHSVRQLEASTPFALLFGVPSAIVGVVSPALGGILDGLVVGPDPASGLFVGNAFQHPDFGLSLEMPAGWKTKNSPAAAIAVRPNGGAAVALQHAAEGDDPVKGAGEDGLDAKLVGQLTRRTISGLPAAQLIAQDGDTRMHLTWIAHQHHVFRVTGVAGI